MQVSIAEPKTRTRELHSDIWVQINALQIFSIGLNLFFILFIIIIIIILNKFDISENAFVCVSICVCVSRSLAQSTDKHQSHRLYVRSNAATIR